MEIITSALSKLGFDWQIALANTINFALVFILLNKLVFKKLAQNIEERKKIIQEGVDNATQSETILAQTKQEADAAKEQARKEALGIIADASHKAQEYTSDAEHRALQLEEKIISDAKKRAESTFESELHAQKIELAEKLVLASKKVFLDEFSDNKKQEEFIVKQLG